MAEAITSSDTSAVGLNNLIPAPIGVTIYDKHHHTDDPIWRSHAFYSGMQEEVQSRYEPSAAPSADAIQKFNAYRHGEEFARRGYPAMMGYDPMDEMMQNTPSADEQAKIGTLTHREFINPTDEMLNRHFQDQSDIPKRVNKI